MSCEADIAENEILRLSPEILNALLKDHSVSHHVGAHRNIIWAIGDYQHLGSGYGCLEQILPQSITGKNGLLIQPRAKKSAAVQQQRIQDKAEVFTPAWVCNKQNNLIDNAWFGREEVFNTEIDEGDKHTWCINSEKIVFPDVKGKTWEDYVLAPRMEITCGEAPYITSRYDATMCDGVIPVKNRIGFLDRKLRVVGENTQSPDEWLAWAFNALHSTYGYEWQGDNLLLAREAVLYTFKEHYEEKFSDTLSPKILENAAYIISWNLWQMDGLKNVVPMSCEWANVGKVQSLFGDNTQQECPACKKGAPIGHLGISCEVVEWKKVSAKEPHRVGSKKDTYIYPQLTISHKQKNNQI